MQARYSINWKGKGEGWAVTLNGDVEIVREFETYKEAMKFIKDNI